MNDTQAKERFTFIKIYPVNYQVEANTDVFELVKRDILFQLIKNKLIPQDYEIPESIALPFFLQTKAFDIVESILSTASKLNASSIEVKLLFSMLKGSKLLSSLEKQYDEFKKGGTNEHIIEEFIERIERNGIYDTGIEPTRPIKPTAPSITNIIVDDLQKIDYSFPFLRDELLFLPALIALCKDKNIGLQVLCDKMASMCHALCAHSDEVIAFDRDKFEKNTVSIYVGRSPEFSQESEIHEFTISDPTNQVSCENGKISFPTDEDAHDELIGSLSEFWRDSHNVHISDTPQGKCDSLQ